MINNYKNLRKYLVFGQNGDTFYDIQIIKRRGDNPDLPRNSHTIKRYYIGSLDEFDNRLDEMITIATATNSRIYINVNRRSYSQIAREMLISVPNGFVNGSFKKMSNIYSSLVGKHSAESRSTKTWVIDVDTKDTEKLQTVVDWISEKYGENVIKDVLPTKNGFHILTSVFRIDVYEDMFPQHEIKKDGLTILYIP